MQEEELLRKGQFYSIYDKGTNLVLEDKTKRGLEILERAVDEKYGVEAEKGMIYDLDGIGYKVAVRWFFPKSAYTLDDVTKIADGVEQRYKAIRETTCPEEE